MLKALLGAAAPSPSETLDGLVDFVGEHLRADRLRRPAETARAQAAR